MAHTDPLIHLLQDWTGALMRRSMQGMIHYMKENELSMSQVGALFQVNRGSSNVSDLGEGLGISIAAASQMLERLVQQGLIVRVEDPQDRRVKHLTLTDKGRRIMQASMQARQGWLDDLVHILSPGEREQVASAIKVMIEKTKQLERSPEAAR